MTSFPNARAAAMALLSIAVARKAQELRNEVVEELSKPGKGRTYEHEREFATPTGVRAVGPKRSAPHTASAPGDAPAVDTGRLRQSIVALKVGETRWRVGTNVKYALYLEFGTRRLAPRPFLRPVIERAKRG